MTKLHCKQVRPLLLWTVARACEPSVGGMWFAWFMRLGWRVRVLPSPESLHLSNPSPKLNQALGRHTQASQEQAKSLLQILCSGSPVGYGFQHPSREVSVTQDNIAWHEHTV